MTYTGKAKDTHLPQHEMRQGHYGYMSLDEFPDATGQVSGTTAIWNGSSWQYGKGFIGVQEADGSPSVSPVYTIKVGNGDLTDLGSGVVRILTAADATGGSGSENDDDRITGNDSVFTTTTGNWTNSGGTMSRDTTLGFRYAPSHIPASLKFVTTATGQYVELAISGTFKAGTRYDALMAVMVEEAPSTLSLGTRFGVIGGDEITYAWTQSGGTPPIGQQYQLYVIQWTPFSDTSSAKLRLTRTGTETGTQTYHIGQARAVRVQSGPGLTITSSPDNASNQMSVAKAGTNLPMFIANGNNPSKIDIGPSFLDLAAGGSAGGLYCLADYVTNEVFTGIYGENVPGDRAFNGGLNIEVGTDYVGFQIAEYDAGTIQIFPDYSDYDIWLQDGSVVSGSNGWHARDSDGNATGLLSRNPWRHFSAAPSGPVEGDVYWNDTTHKPQVYDGSTWHDLY